MELIEMKSDSSLLTGSVPKKLAAFALPLFLGNLLQALYNAVDMLVVGRIVGETGLAAISNASMLCYIINSLGLGLTMGGAVLAAQFKGAGDAQGQRDCVSMLLFASLSASVLVTFAGLAACEPVFRALYVPADAYDDACEYMKAICWGTVFVFGYNAVCSALKGLGDSVTPLYIVAAAAVINIALDILFVGPLALGTVGAAYATVAAQGVAFVASLAYLRRREPAFAPGRSGLRWELLPDILRLGLPTAVQMAVVNAAYLLMTGMLNQFGTAVAAASGVGLKINTFAGMHCWAIGQAITAMAGQCIGAGEMERARETAKTGLRLNLTVTLVVVTAVQLLAEPLVRLFDDSEQVVRDGMLYLRLCCGANSLVYAAMYTLDSFAIGVGAPKVALLNALLDALLIRLPAAWLLAWPLGLGLPGLYLAQAISPVLPALVGTIYFKSRAWERKRPASPIDEYYDIY